MEEGWFNLVELVKRPAVVETFVDILLCAVPIWLAVIIGLLIGWSWRPRWTSLVFIGLRSKLRFVWTAPPGFGARRFYLAFTALSVFSVGRRLWFSFRGRNKDRPCEATEDVAALPVTLESVECDAVTSHPVQKTAGDIRVLEREQSIITENDLEHLLHFLDDKDGDIAWQSLMKRSTSNLTYQAWHYEPETGPIVYRSRTVFEDATPELVRDFFWDDEFRSKWDPMLGCFKILEECSHTGTMIVQWIKKFPFFCSDREYVFGRRIWEAGKTYYCVTKGVPYPAVHRRDKPKRVDPYFSSWVIKPVQSHGGDGQFSACEVALIHYEDMGIPKDVAKLGVRHGMWGTVKKLHAGFRAYQHARKTEASLSRCAQMARITTKLSSHENPDFSNSGEEKNVLYVEKDKGRGRIDWKWVVIGGTVALVCGLRTGIVGKALLLGGGHRVARR